MTPSVVVGSTWKYTASNPDIRYDGNRDYMSPTLEVLSVYDNDVRLGIVGRTEDSLNRTIFMYYTWDFSRYFTPHVRLESDLEMPLYLRLAQALNGSISKEEIQDLLVRLEI